MRGAKKFGIILTTVVQGPESNVNQDIPQNLQTHPAKNIHNLPELTSFLFPSSHQNYCPQAIHTLGTWNTGNWLKASWDNGPILRVNEHYQAVAGVADSNPVAPMHCNFNQD